MKISASVTVRDRGWKAIKGRARSLNGAGVTVGIHEQDGQKKGMDRDWNGRIIMSDVSLIDYTVYNEFGTARAPARPFMRRTFDKKKAEAAAASANLANAALYGHVKPGEALRRLGRWYVEEIRDTIDTAKSWAKPLARVTVEKKGHDLPLVHFFTMYYNIKYKLNRK